MEKRKLNIKQSFVLCLLLVICFVAMTQYFNVEREYLERAPNSSTEYSGIFIESYSESPIRPKNPIDLNLSDKLSHFKESNRNTIQRQTISKCGYDVSIMSSVLLNFHNTELIYNENFSCLKQCIHDRNNTN